MALRHEHVRKLEKTLNGSVTQIHTKLNQRFCELQVALKEVRKYRHRGCTVNFRFTISCGQCLGA